MKKLLNDICRCWSNNCPRRKECARFQQRKTGTVHCSFAYGVDGCKEFIKETK